MPMLTDPRLLAGALTRKNTRGCLLVFVTQETNTEELWKSINDFNYEPETKKRRIDIFFPILPVAGDPEIEAIWQRYNKHRTTPLGVFIGRNGREPGIAIQGVPTTTELLALLRKLDEFNAAAR